MLFLLVMTTAQLAGAQPTTRGVILDQTNLPLPGVRIEVYRGDQVIQSTVTGGDGSFELLPGAPADVVEAALEGFETTRVARSAAEKIVMAIARATDVTNVVASALTSSGSTMSTWGAR